METTTHPTHPLLTLGVPEADLKFARAEARGWLMDIGFPFWKVERWPEATILALVERNFSGGLAGFVEALGAEAEVEAEAEAEVVCEDEDCRTTGCQCGEVGFYD